MNGSPRFLSRKALMVGLCALLAALLFSGLCWDIIRFFKICHHYQELAEKPSLPREVSSHEAIVVLTGDKRRIPKALELLRQRGSPWLVISGLGKGASLLDVLNQQGDAATQLHDHWNKIIAESRSHSTVENVYESGRILLEKGIDRVIVVTSDYHMPRAMKLFQIILPKTETIPYPVNSDSGIWNQWSEYGKNRFFDWYTVKNLIPLQKTN